MRDERIKEAQYIKVSRLWLIIIFIERYTNYKQIKLNIISGQTIKNSVIRLIYLIEINNICRLHIIYIPCLDRSSGRVLHTEPRILDSSQNNQQCPLRYSMNRQCPCNYTKGYSGLPKMNNLSIRLKIYF